MIRSRTREGFTMIELFGVLILISILVVMLLPAVQSAREMARRTSCANNLMQVTLGMKMYHATFERLPVQLSGTDGSTQPGLDNDRRLSVFVTLLPMVGQPELAESIAKPQPYSSQLAFEEAWMGQAGVEFAMEESQQDPDRRWPRGGPEPTETRYRPWRSEVPVYRCPSDPGIGDPAISRTNYAVCLGDGVVAADSGPMKEFNGTFVVDEELFEQTMASMRGATVPRVVTRFSDITDGLANTILLGEIATALGDRDTRTYPVAASGPKELRDQPAWARAQGLIDAERPRFWLDVASSPTLEATTGARRGYRWADGMPLYTAINTILPPNHEITMAADRQDTWGILPPSSRHQGGVNVACADGAVHFVTDSIDAGDENSPTVYLGSPNAPGSESPFGLWGAMGTRDQAELQSL
jgi:competence protein ComGC